MFNIMIGDLLVTLDTPLWTAADLLLRDISLFLIGLNENPGALV